MERPNPPSPTTRNTAAINRTRRIAPRAAPVACPGRGPSLRRCRLGHRDAPNRGAPSTARRARRVSRWSPGSRSNAPTGPVVGPAPWCSTVEGPPSRSASPRPQRVVTVWGDCVKECPRTAQLPPNRAQPVLSRSRSVGSTLAASRQRPHSRPKGHLEHLERPAPRRGADSFTQRSRVVRTPITRRWSDGYLTLPRSGSEPRAGGPADGKCRGAERPGAAGAGSDTFRRGATDRPGGGSHGERSAE